MVEESDIVGVLKDHQGQASLEEISEGLGVPKYGPQSAYALLLSLRSRVVVERRGELWVLLAPETTISRKEAEVASPPEEKKTETAPDVEKIMKAMTKTLAETMKGARVGCENS